MLSSPHCRLPTQSSPPEATSHFCTFEDSIHFLRNFLVEQDSLRMKELWQGKSKTKTKQYDDSTRHFGIKLSLLKEYISPIYDSILIRDAVQRTLYLAALAEQDTNYQTQYHVLEKIINQSAILKYKDLKYKDEMKVSMVELSPQDSLLFFRIDRDCKLADSGFSGIDAGPIFVSYCKQNGFQEILNIADFFTLVDFVGIIDDTLINGYKPIILVETPQKNFSIFSIFVYTDNKYTTYKSISIDFEKQGAYKEYSIFLENVVKMRDKESFKKAWKNIPIAKTSL
ncbi:MAG: hypothetical protein R2798_03775 [Chitinophagales bacterium]|nr:hypothetical protein [Bacteroidota bacterium]MCB9043101.1 hypothetical protein [Chitinophagales bacterium]